MSNRNTDWRPALQRQREEDNLAALARWLLALHDTGERVPESAWEVLREAVERVEKERQRP